jgi:hypothetical protein
MFSTFFRKGILLGTAHCTEPSYRQEVKTTYPNVISKEILEEFAKSSQFRVIPIQADESEVCENQKPNVTSNEEKEKTNNELLEKFPNRISKNDMNELLANYEAVRKYSSVY